MNKIILLTIVAALSIAAGALSATLMPSPQGGIGVMAIPENCSPGDGNHFEPWIPISSFAPHETTMQKAQEKLVVPFKAPSDDMANALGFPLTSVLFGGSEEKYYIVYLVFGTAPIDPNSMSVGDIVDSGHIVVIQTDSGLPIDDVQSLHDNVMLGKFPSDQIVSVNDAPAILSPNQIAVFQGTVIYNILIPDSVSAIQLIAFADSMFK